MRTTSYRAVSCIHEEMKPHHMIRITIYISFGGVGVAAGPSEILAKLNCVFLVQQY